MTKKILAAFTALALCLCAAGCGNVKDEDEKTNSGAAAADKGAASQEDGDTRETDENDADTSEDSKETDGGKSDEGTEKNPDGGERTPAEGFEIDPNNIVYTTYEINDTPTDEEAAQFLSLALEVYQAAYDGDAQRYMELVNYSALAEPYAIAMAEEDWEPLYQTPAKYNAINNMGLEVYFMGGDDILFVGELDGDVEKRADKARRVIEKLDLESEKATEELSYIFEMVQELQPWGGADENTVVWMELDGCDRDGDDLYATFDMGALCGDYNYVIDEVCAWRVDGELGIYFGSALLEDNPCKGMTAEEIKAKAAE